MASMASVKRIRLRRSGIRKTFATASKNFIFDYLSRTLSPCLGLPLASDYCATSAGLLDLLQSRFREHMRLHRDLSRQLARSEHFQPGAQFLDHTQFQEPPGIELVPVELLQAADIHDGVFFAEN